jgi:hypothetical protein
MGYTYFQVHHIYQIMGRYMCEKKEKNTETYFLQIRLYKLRFEAEL